jgi:hypothetical protein
VTFAISSILFAVTYKSQRAKVLLQRGGDPRDEVENAWLARVQCHVCERSYIAVEMDRDPSVTGSPAICIACAAISSSYRKACIDEHVASVGVAGARSLAEGDAVA